MNVDWFALPNNDHPFIPQNLYRMSGGATNDERFEQLGQSWGKHAFTAASSNTCGFGCNGVGGDTSWVWLLRCIRRRVKRQPNRHWFARLGQSIHRKLRRFNSQQSQRPQS